MYNTQLSFRPIRVEVVRCRLGARGGISGSVDPKACVVMEECVEILRISRPPLVHAGHAKDAKFLGLLLSM